MKTEIGFNHGQKFHHQVQTSFQYVRWQLGSRIGAKVAGKFCTSSRGRKEYARNGGLLPREEPGVHLHGRGERVGSLAQRHEWLLQEC
jgi:hypothetical protein